VKRVFFTAKLGALWLMLLLLVTRAESLIGLPLEAVAGPFGIRLGILWWRWWRRWWRQLMPFESCL
jgi:hypothetical protein